MDQYVCQAHATAIKRKDLAAKAAAEHLAPAVAVIANARAQNQAAGAAETDSTAAVASENKNATLVIGGVRDMAWTAVGRPVHNIFMADAFPGGIGTFKTCLPSKKRLRMAELEARILASPAPQWSEEQKKTWAAQIAASREPLEASLAKHAPIENAAYIAKQRYRSAVLMGMEALRAFKRALETLGYSKAQIFEIIPDGAPSGGAPKGDGSSEPGDGGGSAPTPTPKPTTA